MFYAIITTNKQTYIPLHNTTVFSPFTKTRFNFQSLTTPTFLFDSFPSIFINYKPPIHHNSTMAGDHSTAVVAEIQSLLRLVRDVARRSATGFAGAFKKDCSDMCRRVALLAHLLEEIRDYEGDLRPLDLSASSSSNSSALCEVAEAIKAVKRLVLFAGSFDCNVSTDGTAQQIVFQFQCVTSKLEKALAGLPYDHFDISEEVKEQVDLVRVQLKRAAERYGGSQDLTVLSIGLSQSLAKDSDIVHGISHDHNEVESKVGNVSNESVVNDVDEMIYEPATASSDASCMLKPAEDAVNNVEENKKPVIPDDFLCPISLELIRDPVIVSTGQTYERSYIQRWINCGNTTCPKTRQKLQNLILTPNHVLRSLITQWCTLHNVEHPTLLTNSRLKNIDKSFLDMIEAIVRNLSSQSIEEQRAAVSEIRSLSKRSTDNRILIAEAGAIPVLVSLILSEDDITQQHAVTSILNLSIYEDNRELIMLANAVPSIVQVLRTGAMETRENAAATLFSLSLADENKIIIGASGAIPLLVHLLENGSKRGKNDAATALFNLCIYQGNKGRAVRAGVIAVLVKMLTESNGSMVDEALTILSILASHQEAKAAMLRACIIPNLIEHVAPANSRNQENAISILLSLCKRDDENLGVISRLGVLTPLMELANNGTERAKRKAVLLLGHLQRSQQQLQHVDG
ncbi:putative U box domain, armadillo-like helical, Zinc finger, RING/FYVE/PHD-type [Helianthus annuus]|nr:putative U box domain, armadillo-like helical, Zinc finger, RING/FYVE/PHD-type [Helianthus annuus]